MFEEGGIMKTEEERLLDVGGPLQVRDRAPAPGRASVFIEREGGGERRTQTALLGADQSLTWTPLLRRQPRLISHKVLIRWF